MLYSFLVGLYVFIALLILALVLIQQGKDSMGLGALGGGTQMLFGGSGGQTFFQKATWILGFLFMAMSLGLAVTKTSSLQRRYLTRKTDAPIVQVDPQEVPAEDEQAKESDNSEESSGE